MSPLSSLSAEQVANFLSYLDLPEPLRQSKCRNDAAQDLHFLTQLHVHTISTIPYENLSIHYSSTREVSIDPQLAYQKIVTDGRGRGGYCMEISILFNHVLRSLGFNVYTSAVRIRRRNGGVPFGPYTGWVHIVNIVELSDGSKWMIDVGFGGDGATRPLPLVEDQPSRNLGTQEIRLIRDHLPLQALRTSESKMWIYQYRNGEDKPWNSFYAFQEVEAMEADFAIVNRYTSSSPGSPQLAEVLVIKFLKRPKEDESGDHEIYGKRMLVNAAIKQNLGGKTELLQECQSEDERVQALRRHFDLELTEEQKSAVRGWRTELK